MTDPASPPPRPETQKLDTLQHTSPPRESERRTRRPSSPWDRIRILLLLVGAWCVMLAALWGDLRSLNPPWIDVLTMAYRDYWWILALAGLELLRQLHYLLEEHSKGYYRFWQRRVWGATTRRSSKINPWVRYRVARAIKVLFLLFVLANILALILNTSPLMAMIELPSRLIGALPWVFQLAFAAFFVIFQFAAIFWFLSRGGVDTFMPEEVETRFTDVQGQDAVLDRVRENMIFLEDPEAIEDRGGHVPSGILLWGPPGTGKTLIAQAVAGETAKPYVFVDPGAFTNMFMGVGILKVKSLYRKLRKLALRYGGVLVFFDEADSLGNRGQTAGGPAGGWSYDPGPSAWESAPACNGLSYLSPPTRELVLRAELPRGLEGDGGRIKGFIMGGGMGGGGMGTLQALLSEMQGLEKPRGFFNRYIRRLLGMKPKPPPKYRILHIFATNMPQALDEAMLRPGRIDRIYKVGYPQKQGRAATFGYYLDKVENDLTDAQVEELATMSLYATGATIKDMVNEALIIALREGRQSITWTDIIRAKQLKEHGLPDDHEYIVRERHAVAVHEACHAVVMYRTQKDVSIDLATIERRGDTGGFVSFIPAEDRFTKWRSEREIDVMSSLASLAGERMFFEGDNSAGVGNDMMHATTVVTDMLAYGSMGETIASHAVTKFGALARGRTSSAGEDGVDRNLMETELGRQIEAKLRVLYDRTWELLEANRSEVLAVAHALEFRRTMTGEDIAAVIEGREGRLVDGRPYRDPAFIASLEAYHARAVEAHKANAGIADDLPVPVLAGASQGHVQVDPSGHGNGGVARGQADPPRPDTP